MKLRTWLCILFCLVITVVYGGLVGSTAQADYRQFATGLKEPALAQVQWMNKNFPVIKKIQLNDIALERINMERQNKGQRKLLKSELNIVPIGEEAEYAPAITALTNWNVSATYDILPGSVDNSLSPAFPPIRSQGGLGSCVAWATTYYQFTYENNLVRNRTASKGDNAAIFSPKWTYNMINGGYDGGAYFSEAYALLEKHGAVSWAEFPYDYNYLAWCLDTEAWRDAINYRPLSWGRIYNADTNILINDLKAQLANGHVMVIGTYVYSWVSKTISDDPSTTEDNTFVGQKIASYMRNTRSGGHAMTLVGYNDNIWCDLNGNSRVDTGEKGAFKIANSWGTSDWNNGYRWVTYDSLRTTSAVPSTGSWPTSDRYSSGIFLGSNIYTITVHPEYTPSMVAEFTLSHSKRGQLRMSLGMGDTSATTPTSIWYPEAIYASGGNYAFDGTTNICEATFVFDFSELSPLSGADGRWFVNMYDTVSGATATIKAYKLYEVTATGDVLDGICNNVPATIDNEQTYVWIDNSGNPLNQSPVADLQASPTTGNMPLNVNFNGSASHDPDGQIVSYAWDFGDGFKGTGSTVEHTYNSAGTFTARLVVTDDHGATGVDTCTITIVNQNTSPVADLQASPTTGNMPLNVNFNGSASRDPDGQIVSYAWDFGDGSKGVGSTVEHTYNSAGTFTARLVVTDNDGATGVDTCTITVINTNIISAPSNLTASVSIDNVTLTWQDNSENEEGFYIERAMKDKGGYTSYIYVGTLGANITTFTDKVESSGNYKYRVRAFSGNGTIFSEYSNDVSVRTKEPNVNPSRGRSKK